MTEKFTWPLGCGIIVAGDINTYTYIHIHIYNFFSSSDYKAELERGVERQIKQLTFQKVSCCLWREIFFFSGLLETLFPAFKGAMGERSNRRNKPQRTGINIYLLKSLVKVI